MLDTFVDELREREQGYRRELEDLNRQRDDLTRKIADHAKLLEHVQALLKAELGPSYRPEGTSPLFGIGDVDWTRLTVREGVLQLLSDKGRAMHADEIRDELQERGMAFSRKDPKATIVTALIRAADRGLVARTAPNTYKLVRKDDDIEGGES